MSDIYHIEYKGKKDDFLDIKDAYSSGEDVTLYYSNVGTDLNYYFYVDNEEIYPRYNDEKQAYEINFTMPDHNVVIDVKEVNSFRKNRNVYYIENLNELFNYDDSKLKELNIPINKDDISFDIEGKLFDAYAKGMVYIDPLEVHLFIDNIDLNLDDCSNNLTQLYGSNINWGEEPYVVSNGGAIYWEEYKTERGIIKIKSGSENDFYELVYEVK